MAAPMASPDGAILRIPRAVPLQPIAESLASAGRTLVWLDSARTHAATGRWSVLAWDPWLTLRAAEGRVRRTTSLGSEELAGDPLDALRQTLAAYRSSADSDLPPQASGVLVALGYELGRWIERLPAPKSGGVGTPDLLAFGMLNRIVIDAERGCSWLIAAADPHQPAAAARADAQRRLDEIRRWAGSVAEAGLGPAASAAPSAAGEPAEIHPTITQAAFEAMVRRAQAHIAAGDIFQANLAQRFDGRWPGAAWPLYRALRSVNPSPFACFVQTPELAIVSCSPERLVRALDGRVSARPIAGTRPRGQGADEDLANSLELILSDKERAEHIMLVDLARNDLGRVCAFGSVAVDELMALEDYSHVIHLVSNVEGVRRPGCDAVDVIRAVFPGGTITGCPKVRAMEIIDALEPVPRGLYTGSVGWIGLDGSLDLNILIRTLVLRGQALSFHVGAGIVADSQPAREYAETLAKAGALLKALDAQRLESASESVRG
jgi:aminodeoxychorismate synthase component I